MIVGEIRGVVREAAKKVIFFIIVKKKKITFFGTFNLLNNFRLPIKLEGGKATVIKKIFFCSTF